MGTRFCWTPPHRCFAPNDKPVLDVLSRGVYPNDDRFLDVPLLGHSPNDNPVLDSLCCGGFANDDQVLDTPPS
ncbi:hypothetical protein CgunFtcFv8_012133 [Champsocephalus gunnari]|uniref:Uncharacterized protein n=1 Tax=Champsocephalus gunnari TaxID=52237 RepID=A0AAN8HIQ4_CHAGU|nr:hypothetical protein CgunFtcFv8_012133 [Champsocephalus gunnari]